MAVETNECPKCGGSLQAVSGARTIVCGYCGTEVTITSDDGSAVASGNGRANLITSEALERVRTMIAAGDYIEAIKLYRESTGASLKDAKDAVDALAAGAGVEVPKPKLWPCPVLIALFAGWIALVGFSPRIAEWLLMRFPGGDVSEGAVDAARVALPIAIVFVSLCIMIVRLSRMKTGKSSGRAA